MDPGKPEAGGWVVERMSLSPGTFRSGDSALFYFLLKEWILFRCRREWWGFRMGCSLEQPPFSWEKGVQYFRFMVE
ncbi:hypothetical protein SAMN04488112_11614 [Melghirimyces thermohalophilus]|uniref:Uncharacterized protein n=1 Tax=Melghirimyces thermohalophilus TaxID=1236220 RepID=A0A1G6P9V2_9BACL|nr:hypothetical protein SAMN04488112_11614 [Melghirimyces thermohalophilus]